MQDFIAPLQNQFKAHANPIIAKQQKAYLRNQFDFYGLKTPLRKTLQKPFLVPTQLPNKNQVTPLIKTLWQKPQREFQYVAQELAFKYHKQQAPTDIALYEYMVTHKSWWDTVDFIATKLIGTYFKTYPDQKQAYVTKWLASNNMWLQRSALLFQLKYKNQTDTTLLSNTINALTDTNLFFINKAIGWVLREYSKTNPSWVTTFVNHSSLHPLSKREALRLLK